MALKLITPAAGLAVSLTEIKANANIDISDDDAKLTLHILAATRMAEQNTGRALMTQTWELTLDAFPTALQLTRVPVQSVTSVTCIDADGNTQVLPTDWYALDNADDFGFAYITPAYGASFPITRNQINAVTVRYVAGYADAASVPPEIKQWICLVAGMLYENSGILSERQMFDLKFAHGLLDGPKVY